MILVNIETQQLHLLDNGTVIRSYPISTALNGTGNEEGSGKTPLGLHRIHSKIGDRADPLAIFKSRVPTGEIAEIQNGGDAIVGRILWLEGLEPGINQGKGVDSHERYIYIHGTNDTERIGYPVSAGCIRMLPSDIIDLFDRVSSGMFVQIT